MQVEAIYDNGTLQFTEELPLRHTRFKVMVEIPDQEIVNHPAQDVEYSVATAPKATSLNERLAEIMGKAYRERPAGSKEEDRQAYLELMEARHKHG